MSVEFKCMGRVRWLSPWPIDLLLERIKLKNVVKALIIAVLFAGICCIATSGNTRLDRYMTLTYAVVAALGLQLSLRSLPVGLFVIGTAISFYIHPLTPILAALAAVIYGGGFLFLITAHVPKSRLYDLICLYAIATVLWQILQIAGYTIGYNPIYQGSHTLVGLQTNVDETSALMGICLPAFFRRRWAWLIPVPLAGLVMAQATVGAMSAGIVSFIYLLTAIKSRAMRVMSVILILACSASYVTFIDPFSWEIHKNSRLQTWKESAYIALQKPVRGWGYGQFCTVVPLLSTPTQLLVEDRKRLYLEVEDKQAFLKTANKITGGNAEAYYKAKQYPNSFFFEAHNDYVEVLFAAGIPGILLLLAALGHTLWLGWKRTDKLPFYGLMASCIGATVFFVWQTVSIAVVTVVWAGLCMAPAHTGKRIKYEHSN